MLFNSYEFAVFLPTALVFYFAFSGSRRLVVLFIFSSLFYMCAIPRYILILYFIILLDFAAGILIEQAETTARKRILLAVSVAANIGTLAVFKYANFFFDLAHLDSFKYNVILPVGLSFHTFQSIAYTIEVYRGRVPAERSLLVYANYVLFFPQLVAGPIERPQHLIGQFKENHRFKKRSFIGGGLWILRGLVKKLFVADPLGLFVDRIYEKPAGMEPSLLALATYAFAVQIYCDFSGYSDIAFGSARMMGFRFAKNFAKPYTSANAVEFWRRWHISLSSWFRDYVYIPLGGSRSGSARTVLNLLIVFLLSGLWHGANLTFAAWGLLNGLYVIVLNFKKKLVGDFLRVPVLVQKFVTFNFICLTWVFFRAATLSDAAYIFKSVFSRATFRKTPFLQYVTDHGFTYLLPLGLLLTLVVVKKPVSEWIEKRLLGVGAARRSRFAFDVAFYAIFAIVGVEFLILYTGYIAQFGQSIGNMKFIYYQF